MEISSVTKSKDSCEEDMRINPERSEILHIGIQQHQIGPMPNDLPCKDIATKDDTPCYTEFLSPSNSTHYRVRQTGNLPKFRLPAL
jgi:hypothetical protein